ncbi:MAG: PQQ-dependent sugar dehydrogenase, partial [Dehalococcoidia bacterium]
SGDVYPQQYRGNLFFGDWNTGSVRRLALGEDDEVLLQEAVVSGEYGPVADVATGPDGFLYFTTPTAIVRITRLAP